MASEDRFTIMENRKKQVKDNTGESNTNQNNNSNRGTTRYVKIAVCHEKTKN